MKLEEKSDLEELKKIKSEILVLKKDFLLNRQNKEKYFSQGEENSKKINDLYLEIKEIEKNHNLDELNSELKCVKEEFDSLKLTLDEKEKIFQNLNTYSKKMLDNKIKGNFDSKKKLEEKKKLEFKLETHVSTLKEEADINKKIQEIDKEILEGLDFEDKDYGGAKKDLKLTKKKYFICEKRIRSLYKKIRLASKEKKAKYTLISEIKKDKKKDFENFRKFKKIYLEILKKLKEKFEEEKKFSKEVGGNSDFDNNKSESLRKAQKEVEEKILNQKELTTEDFLILQTKK